MKCPFEKGDIVNDLDCEEGRTTKYGKFIRMENADSETPLIYCVWASTPEKLIEGSYDVPETHDAYYEEKYELVRPKKITNWKERLERWQ